MVTNYRAGQIVTEAPCRKSIARCGQPKTVIDTERHSLDRLLHSFNARKNGEPGIGESHVPISKAIVVIFKPGRPIIGERPFEPGANSPAAARFTCRPSP